MLVKMKRIISILVVLLVCMSGVYAQEQLTENTTEQAESDSTLASKEASGSGADVAEGPDEELTFHQIIKTKFIEGGAGFMGIVLVSLILGLAIAIERIIYLNVSTTNTSKLMAKLEDALKGGDVEKAKEVCRKNTRGPVGSICYQGLDRIDEGIDIVEKSVISYGGVQMGLLEKNISWLSLFIALAPMLGFNGNCNRYDCGF